MPAAAQRLPAPRLPALINNDRNHFGAIMVARGDADAMVTG
jgi:phosphotransacetylase